MIPMSGTSTSCTAASRCCPCRKLHLQRNMSSGTLTIPTFLRPGLSSASTTGAISGTIATSANNSTPYAVTVSATDGTNSASQSFNWSVAKLGLNCAGRSREPGRHGRIVATERDRCGRRTDLQRHRLTAGSEPQCDDRSDYRHGRPWHFRQQSVSDDGDGDGWGEHVEPIVGVDGDAACGLGQPRRPEQRHGRQRLHSRDGDLAGRHDELQRHGIAFRRQHQQQHRFNLRHSRQHGRQQHTL